MLRVTVMMFKDIVESVTLLKDEAWREGGVVKEKYHEICGICNIYRL